jgi:glycosyltransferase involved in cell wall biosynthesis
VTARRLAIIVPAYNAEPWIAECIRSVRAQTMPDFECVIVDDGSADETWKIARDAREHGGHDRRFSVYSIQHVGVAGAINAGVFCTGAPWLAVVGADDLLDPHYCEVLLAALGANPGARVAYSTLAEFGDGATGAWPLKPYAPGLLATENLIPGVAIHARALYDAVGGFPEDMPLGGEDWAYWVKAERLGLLDPPPVWVRDPLYHYRRHAASLSARSISPNIEAIRMRIAALAGEEV